MDSVAPHSRSAVVAFQMPAVRTPHWEDSKDFVASHWMSAVLASRMLAAPGQDQELLHWAAVRPVR